MFTLDVEKIKATPAISGDNLITNPVDISNSLNLNDMNRFAEIYIGNKFAKGTSKSDACSALFLTICKQLNIDPNVKLESGGNTMSPDKEKTASTKAKEKTASTKAKEKTTRQPWSKNYVLKEGYKPKEKDGKKECMWGDHADVITEAITSLRAVGKNEATREEIMAEAIKLKLYEKKKSTQGVNAIFSWWRKSLHICGWIDVAPKPEPVKTEAEKAADIKPTS